MGCPHSEREHLDLELAEVSRRVLATWSDFDEIECHIAGDWRTTVLPHLIDIGIVEGPAMLAEDGMADPEVDQPEPRFRLRPLHEALSIAQECWQRMPSELADADTHSHTPEESQG